MRLQHDTYIYPSPSCVLQGADHITVSQQVNFEPHRFRCAINGPGDCTLTCFRLDKNSHTLCTRANSTIALALIAARNVTNTSGTTCSIDTTYTRKGEVYATSSQEQEQSQKEKNSDDTCSGAGST